MNSDLLNTIYTRRSVRKFTGEGVKKEDLLSILRSGMAAPSAVNVQP
jgi:nitroreductase